MRRRERLLGKKVPRNILSISLFGTFGSRVLRMLAVDGSDSLGYLLCDKNDTAVDDLAVTVVRLNV